MGEWEVRMQKPVRHLAEALTGIRSGSLSASVVATFRISWQGGSSPIGQLATIRQERDRIVVAPFDRSLVPAIVRALQEARQNAYALDPTRLCVSVPPLSGEQRAEIANHVKVLGEEAKVAIRAIRQEIRKLLAASGRRSDRAVQAATDAAIAQVEQLIEKKLAELSC
jgi:ribosome recycling factor